jgi:hypothetical protein
VREGQDDVVQRQDPGRAADEVVGQPALPAHELRVVAHGDQEAGEHEKDGDPDVPLAHDDVGHASEAPRGEMEDEDEQRGYGAKSREGRHVLKGRACRRRHVLPAVA